MPIASEKTGSAHSQEGGFETRPYISNFFFALFAFFVAKSLPLIP
jgi:hypothetical protein